MAVENWIRIAAQVGNTIIEKTITPPGDGSIGPISATIADEATAAQVNVAIDVSAMTYIYIHSTQAMTGKTNSSSEPQETLTLEAGVPLVWYPGCGHAKPFSDDVTAIYFANASGAEATLSIIGTQDVTP